MIRSFLRTSVTIAVLLSASLVSAWDGPLAVTDFAYGKPPEQVHTTLTGDAFLFASSTSTWNDDSQDPIVRSAEISGLALTDLQEEVEGDAAGENWIEREALHHYNPQSSNVIWLTTVEAVFLRLTKSDGMRGGQNGGLNASNAKFDYDITPRISLARIGPNGIGIRARYWEYSHDKISANGQQVIADTYLADIELFERIDLSCCTALDWSAGIRFHDFDFDREGSDDHFTLDKAWGGIVGVQLNRCLGHGALYGRARWGIVVGEQGFIHSQGVVDNHMSRSQTSLGLGYAVSHDLPSGAIIAGFTGYEWRYWDNYVGSNQGGDDVLTGIGFDGFHLGIGLQH